MPRATANQVADYIIAFCNERGELITNLKLQKLMYYAQAWHLAFYGEPLFDERLEAWVRGPVQPETYQRFKVFGFQPIVYKPDASGIPQDVKTYIDEVMKAYGGMGAFELERYTHNEAPWINARGVLPPEEPSNAVISTDDMRQFYKARLDAQENRKGQ
jgi:uncharacterized phage-associated protein